MMDIGKKELKVVKVSLFTLMEISMKEIIKMEKDMVMGYGRILNFIVMKDIGKMECKVA